LYIVKYLARRNGEEPVRLFLDELEASNIAQYHKIATKIEKLEYEGLKLLNTQMMKKISSIDALYELRGGQCRVLVYHDTTKDAFVLLNGFLKKGRSESREIEKGLRLLTEYLSITLGGE
jgi:hypothetical protein